jgi:hypothetical protein
MYNKSIVFVLSFLFLFNILFPSKVRAEVCFSDTETTNIITLLDASERDLDYIKSCESLVKELYNKLEERDKTVIILTKDLIQAKQDVIKYKASRDTWRKVVIYGGTAGVVVIILTVAPTLL